MIIFRHKTANHNIFKNNHSKQCIYRDHLYKLLKPCKFTKIILQEIALLNDRILDKLYIPLEPKLVREVLIQLDNIADRIPLIPDYVDDFSLIEALLVRIDNEILEMR